MGQVSDLPVGGVSDSALEFEHVCVIYHLLKYQEDYVPLDLAIYEFKAAEARRRWLRAGSRKARFRSG